MTTSTLDAAGPASLAASTSTRAPGRATTHTTADHLPLLALLAPLLLFAHGIVSWVDGLDTLDDASPFGGLRGLGGLGGLAAAHDQGALSVTASALLVLSVGGFAWLTAGLGARLHHLPLATPTVLLAAFGAGATGAVWLGHLTGLLGDTIPSRGGCQLARSRSPAWPVQCCSSPGGSGRSARCFSSSPWAR